MLFLYNIHAIKLIKLFWWKRKWGHDCTRISTGVGIKNASAV